MEGRKFIITGACGSIGRSLVTTFSNEGAVLAIDILPECKFAGAPYPIDYLDASKSSESVLGAVIDGFVRSGDHTITVLINCAGYIHSAPLIDFTRNFKRLSLEDFEAVLRGNLYSTFIYTSHFVAAVAESRRRAVIVNFGSVSANGERGQTAYAAAKAGVRALTSVWAKELGPLGIRVCEVSPGVVESAHTDRDLTEAQRFGWMSRASLGRLTAIESVVKAVRYAVECDDFHGRRVEIDSGLNY